MHCEHRVVTIDVAPAAGETPAVLRVSDDALIERRWKPDGRAIAPRAARAENRDWLPSAHAERIVAARYGIAGARDRALRVAEVRDDAPFDANAGVFALATPLSDGRFAALAEAIARRPDTVVRVLAQAMPMLPALLELPLQRLVLALPFGTLPRSQTIRELRVEGQVPLDAVVDAFPSLASLEVSGRGSVDLAPLAHAPLLQTLSLAGVSLRGALPAVSALRLARVTGLRSLDAIALAHVRSLSVEHLHDLARIDALASAEGVEQLELRGLWQFELRDAECTLRLPRLLRAEIDIGGLRKNVELYRRAAWAYPWPFRGYAATVSEDRASPAY